MKKTLDVNYFLNCVLYLAATEFALFPVGRVMPKICFQADHFPFRLFRFDKEGHIANRQPMERALRKCRRRDGAKIFTREQLAVMLWRYAKEPAATDKELHFSDADQASGWALEALRWAVENGIVNGKGEGILDPGGFATRAQVAQMLMNFIQQ